MKITNIKNGEKFFKMIEDCEGKVEMVTKEGDVLNLKSTLAQFIALAKFINVPDIEVEMLFGEPKDAQKVMEFMMYQNE